MNTSEDILAMIDDIEARESKPIDLDITAAVRVIMIANV